MDNKTIFLGGTCNGSQWRERLIPSLNVSFYNPVVAEWDESVQREELYQRAHCKKCLYVISPLTEGFYSIAEIVDDSNKRPEKTIFYILEEDNDKTFTEHQLKSLKAIGAMIEKNGARWAKSFKELISILNA